MHVSTGEELRLLVCGFIRPEADFTTLDALIERIHKDADVSRSALDDDNYSAFSRESFLLPA